MLPYNVITRLLIRRRWQGLSERRKCNDGSSRSEAREERYFTAGFKGGGRGHEPRNVGGLLKLQKAGKYSLLEPLKGVQSHQHLDFNPVKPISHF